MWTTTSSPVAAIDGGRAIAVDGAGNVYATGAYSGAETFGTTPMTCRPGSQDALVWKLNGGGGFRVGRGHGQQRPGLRQGHQLDGNGNVLVTGGWGGRSSNNNFNPEQGNAVKLINHGGFDIFLAKSPPSATGA